MRGTPQVALVLTTTLLLAGCAKSRSFAVARYEDQGRFASIGESQSPSPRLAASSAGDSAADAPVTLASFETPEAPADNQPPLSTTPREQAALLPAPPPELLSDPELLPTPTDPLPLDRVIDSVQRHYPLIRAAATSRGVAAGELLSARGEFDHNLRATSQNQPLGFYRTYRQQIVLERNTLWGGSVFGGYHIGRGSFEPWYLERETNDGGEFSAGLVLPLMQNRWIDPNRAALWQAQIEANRVEPEIRTEIIIAVREATITYWQWVAAGENYQIAQSLLDIAVERNLALERQVEAGDLPDIVLVDNRRIIVSREANLINAERELEQSAIELSLFLRTEDGSPWIPSLEMLPPRFPTVSEVTDRPIEADIELALRARPELQEMVLLRRQMDIELDQARNMMLPTVNAALLGSKDVGEPAKELNDKGPFILEAGITVDVPLQRRRALGQIRAAEAQLARIQVELQFQSEKIATEVQTARVAIEAANQRVTRMRESLELAIQVEQAERRAFELGDSNLLNVNLREQQRADAALDLVLAQLDYYLALADFDAARGVPLNSTEPAGQP